MLFLAAYSLLITKKSLYLSLILRLQFFEKQSCKAGALLVIKPFSIPQTLRRVSVSPKKKKKTAGFFQTRFYFWFTFLDNTLHKSETNPRPPQPNPTQPPPQKKKSINIVCKYLRQVLVASFGVASLPICCNIEYGEGVWFISAKRTIPDFRNSFWVLPATLTH